MISDDIMTLVNSIDEHAEEIRLLSDLAPLIDDQGHEYFAHSIMLLMIVGEEIRKIEGAMTTLSTLLRCQCEERSDGGADIQQDTRPSCCAGCE